MNLKKRWTEHLDENKMNYIEHLIFALYHGVLCCLAGCLLMIHSLLPCFFQTTGSDLIESMRKRFKKRG